MCLDSEEQALGRHKQICESERGVATVLQLVYIHLLIYYYYWQVRSSVCKWWLLLAFLLLALSLREVLIHCQRGSAQASPFFWLIVVSLKQIFMECN